MLRKFFFVAAGFFAALAFTPCFAVPTPTITISGNGSIALAVAPFSGSDGAAMTKTVQNDLALSGFFSFADAGRASMTVNGSSSGSALQGKVVDRSGSNVLLRTYQGGPREKAHAFANDIIETLTGTKGMAGSKIAFIATRSGSKELYTADYDGSNMRQMTRDNTISVAPAISPDGRRIAYTSYLHGYADIYMIDLASGQRERIVKFPGTNSGAAFSPGGDQIACSVSRDGNPELYVVSANGSGARRLTHTPGVESSPSWSPTGNEIVYSSDDTGSPQLVRIPAAGGSGRRLATGHNYCTKPSWSPDGKKIAFNIREGGSFQVAVLDLASNGVRVVTGGDEARDPVWGPDSRHLLFTQGGNLMLLDVQTARKVALLSGLGSISEPAWSH
ncbi:MAG: biopolymer transporter Tol [Verrucomicrobia bacterium]|nr:biopolymer transporter Tol [Verrucomicrobiota bacterium]